MMRRLLSRPAVNRPLTSALRPIVRGLSQDVLMHMPVVRDVEVRPPGCDPVLLASDGSDAIAAMLFWRGWEGWEPTTLCLLSALVAPGATVVDVGANTGLFAVLAGRCDPTVRVHAFEPVGRVFARLEANVARNRLANVACHRLAVSETSGSAVLRVPRGDAVPMMASLVAGWTDDVESETVDCVTLDGFVDTSGVARVDVLKIDAEGSEEAVLRGGARTIAGDRPFVICEVLTRTDQSKALTSLLGGHGYRFFAIAPDGLDPRAQIQGGIDDDESHNFLCVHRDRVAEVGGRLRERVPSAQLSRWRVWSAENL